MADRLDELRRQRALAQEQLAWIDREIAELTSTTPAAPAAPVEPSIPSTRTRPSLPSMPADPAARPPSHTRPKLAPSLSLPKPPPVVIGARTVKSASEFAEFQVDAENARKKARRGCLFYAALALLLLGLGLAAFLFLRYPDHPFFGGGKSQPAAKNPGSP